MPYYGDSFNFLLYSWAAFAFSILPRYELGKFSLVTLKMEAICSSETSVLLTRAKRHDIPEDNILNY
jgi:hypothetical protein